MKKKSIRTGFIGAGNMAQAMMKALRGKAELYAFDIDLKKLDKVSHDFKAHKVTSIKALVSACDVVVLAVKPADMEFVLWKLAGIGRDKTVISIAAGITIGKIQSILGKVPVIRVMPNTPALAGEGACGYSLSAQAKAGSRAEALVKACCKVAVKLDEKYMNAVTAVSGSGPAYFFYAAEAMMNAGKKLGLKEKELKLLVGQTIRGAGEMILTSKEKPGVLREMVTSKGGTTERALAALEKAGVGRAFEKAIFAAKKRGDEMAGK
ncbi:MAG TPA: pyrroline-5-carboxylate reductase [Candidatus Goldiibacteriota bacterium]|nr:pyrroline-5-carboxylate reductase [Candidatus Goldiibacteriota bacterium]